MTRTELRVLGPLRRMGWFLTGLMSPFVDLLVTGDRARLRLVEFGRFALVARRLHLPLGEAFRRALWLQGHVSDRLEEGGRLMRHDPDGSVTEVRFPWGRRP